MQRFPNSSQDSSHFATLQRPRRGPNNNNSETAPERPPPPLPPRSYPSQSQLGFQSSQSAFNINHMGMPWNYQGNAGYPMDFQQAAMMGYPVGTMRRTPSNQSMGGIPQQQQPFFGWGGPVGFGPPMTQQEMEFELQARRGSQSAMWSGQGQSYPQPQQAPPRPPSVTQSQPVTPQGSFRRKSRPPPPHHEQRQQEQTRRQEMEIMQDRYNQNSHNQSMNQRPLTPRGGLNRMAQSPINFQENLRELEEDARIEYQASSSDSPEGPWTCEHCTFINPMSTNICTICCKTHRSSKSKKSSGSGGKPETYPRKGSSSSTNDNEEIPVIQSKLSISRGDQQQATINLIESVERVRTPTKDRRPQFPSGTNHKNKITPNTGNENEDEDEDNEDEEELENQAQHHRIKINTKKPKIISAKSNSNEDVYGSVPVQGLTISPKIGIE